MRFSTERLLQKILINKQMNKKQTKKNIIKSVNLVTPLLKFLNAKLDKAQF
jgi:hypothetical protein